MKHETIAAAAPGRTAGIGAWRSNLRDYGLLASIWRLFGAEGPHLLASPDTSKFAV